MKKENIVLTDEEKMKKRFALFRKIISWAEAFFIAMPIVVIVLALICGVGILVGGENLENGEIELFNFENNYSEINNGNVAFKTKSPIVDKVFMICEICDYIITVFILDYLKKIFGEIAENGTPFTEYNIKYLDRIRNVVIIAGIVRVIAILFSIRAGMGLGLVLVILSISSIFKYGYKLQIQADETL